MKNIKGNKPRLKRHLTKEEEEILELTPDEQKAYDRHLYQKNKEKNKKKSKSRMSKKSRRKNRKK